MSEGRPTADETSVRTVGPEPVHPRPPTLEPGRKRRKGPSELALRLLSAAVLVPGVLYAIVAGGVLYLAVVALLILIAQREFYGLIEDKGAHPLVGLGLATGVGVPVVAYLGNEYHATILMTASLLALMVAQLGKAQITEALASISGTFFGVFYIGWLLSHAIVLRFFYDAALAKYDPEDVIVLGFQPDTGIFLMIFAAAVVVLCDVGAYFAGRFYGRRKLAPKISPGKTVEGALGGVLLGTLAGLAVRGVFQRFWPELVAAFPWTLVIPFGIILSVGGIVGDLVESVLKRDAERKDAGALLPGMGGLLDRIDSALLGIPLMYYMLLFYVYLRVG